MRAKPGQRRPTYDRVAGFTLVEMLVTLTIIATIMGTLAASMARRDLSPAPYETAKQVQSMLYRARSEAIMSGGNRTVVISVDQKRFDYQAREPVFLAGGQRLRVVTGRELINANGNVSLIFLADGGASGADIEITDERGRSATVRVHWLTGLPVLAAANSQ